MNNNTFTRIVNDQIARSTDVLTKKQAEYATDEDRLHNFHAGAGLTGRTPEQVCGGFLLKHVVSIFDMIESGEPQRIDLWNEKITDMINYGLLLRAIVEETEGNKTHGVKSTYLYADDRLVAEVKYGDCTGCIYQGPYERCSHPSPSLREDCLNCLDARPHFTSSTQKRPGCAGCTYLSGYDTGTCSSLESCVDRSQYVAKKANRSKVNLHDHYEFSSPSKEMLGGIDE